MTFPLDGLKFYFEPKEGAYTGGQYVATYREIGPSKLSGNLGTAAHTAHDATTTNEHYFEMYVDSNTATDPPTFLSQANSLGSARLDFSSTGQYGVAPTAFKLDANNDLQMAGAFMIWLYVSPQNTTTAFVAGDSTQCHLGVKVNDAGTHWYIPNNVMPKPFNTLTPSTDYESELYPVNKWYCIIVNSVVKKNTIRIDGGSVATQTRPTYIQRTLYVNDVVDTTTEFALPVGIANQEMFFNEFFENSSVTGTDHFSGRVGTFAIWDKGLSKTELTSIYNKFKGRFK